MPCLTLLEFVLCTCTHATSQPEATPDLHDLGQVCSPRYAHPNRSVVVVLASLLLNPIPAWSLAVANRFDDVFSMMKSEQEELMELTEEWDFLNRD